MSKLVLKATTSTPESLSLIYSAPKFVAEVGEMFESLPLSKIDFSHFEFFGFKVVCWPWGDEEANSGVFCLGINASDVANFRCEINVSVGTRTEFDETVDFLSGGHTKLLKFGKLKNRPRYYDDEYDDYDVIPSSRVFPAGSLAISINCKKINISLNETRIQKLSKDLEIIMEDQDSCDTNIVVNKISIPVHQCILAARSPVFRAMFNSNMKESHDKEILIDGLSENTIREMVFYLYTGKIPNLDKCAEELVIAGDIYQLDELKEACEIHLLNTITTENVTSLFTFADLYKLKKLKSACSFVICKNLNNVLKSENCDETVFSKPTLTKELFSTFATFLSDL